MIRNESKHKFLLITGISVFIIMFLLGCTLGTSKEIVKGNLIIQSKTEDFKKGKLEGTTVSSGSNSKISISKGKAGYAKSGLYTSQTIYTEPFQTMNLSCNSDTPNGTSVKVEVQVMVGSKWSKWLNWGTWGGYIKAGSNLYDQEDDLATMSQDVLIIKGQGKTASAIKYKLTLYTSNKAVTPSVRMIAASINNNKKTIAKVYKDSLKQQDYTNIDKVLNVPKFSQMIRDKNIAGNICSPTSVSMVMNYYGINVLPEECAWGAYDNLALLFGNWAFNCAYAGSYGLEAYTDYFNSMDDLKREIYNGHPVVASVHYKSDESISGDLPVLHGAPIDQTGGHLVVVCGFTHENGKEYVIVNDPAAKDDNSVRVKYLSNEFKNAWINVVYVIHKLNNVNIKPRRTVAKFISTGNKRVGMNGTEYEYQLKYNNSTIDISRDNVNTILVNKDGGQYKYIYPNSSKKLWFTGEDGSGQYKFIIITSKGIVYSSQIAWKKN